MAAALAAISPLSAGRYDRHSSAPLNAAMQNFQRVMADFLDQPALPIFPSQKKGKKFIGKDSIFCLPAARRHDAVQFTHNKIMVYAGH